MDADGTHDVRHTVTDNSIVIDESIHVVGIFVATTEEELRSRIDQQQVELLESENAISFDPAGDKDDREQLREYAEN